MIQNVPTFNAKDHDESNTLRFIAMQGKDLIFNEE
jgi:hypothetical protein